MQKRQNIELARMVSAFGIVYYHSGVAGTPYFYSALIVFGLLSACMAGVGSSSLGWVQVKRRFQRLMIPWMVWFVIYGLANFLKHKPLVKTSHGWVAGVLSGTSEHLWYLPFIFIFLLVLDFLKTKLTQKTMAIASASLGIVFLATTPWWRAYSVSLGYPYAQYFHAAPSILMGTFMLYFDKTPPWAGRLALALMLVAAVSVIPYAGVGLPYLMGICVGILLLYCKDLSAYSVNLEAWSKLTLGIYLVHKIFLNLLKQQFAIEGVWLPLLAFGLSAALIWVLQTAFPKLSRYVA
jgi:surface polysaccharide O-acyltransferase-like enzyme